MTDEPVIQQIMNTYTAVRPKVVSTFGRICSGTSSVVIRASREGAVSWAICFLLLRVGAADSLRLDLAVLHPDHPAGLLGDGRVVGAGDDGDAELGTQV